MYFSILICLKLDLVILCFSDDAFPIFLRTRWLICSQHDSDSAANTNSDRVERIVGSSSNSSELNDSGDQVAESQQEQEAEETILETSTSRYGWKMTRVLRDNYVLWHNIHVEM